MDSEKILTSWTSYPQIFNLGHRAVRDLLTVEVNVEEKVDGSQFSFCRTYDDELLVRSKGATMYVDAPEKMFSKIVEYVKSIKDKLVPGWTYRGEYLQKPKHNALCYERIPTNNFILFDINTADQEFAPYSVKHFEASRLGFETVPLLYSGKIDNIEAFREFLDNISILGGQKIEGVVIKPKEYNLYGPDKKVLFGKFVSEAFKEVHKASWGESNPKQNDILEILGNNYRNQARWNKAIMHLKEAGKIEDSPKDIGFLIKEIPADIKKECEEEIKEALFKWAWPQVARKSVAGFPEFYKEELLKKQFDTGLDKP
jgi:RNA ligase-like protein